MAAVSREYLAMLLRSGVPRVRGPAVTTLDVTCYPVRKFTRARKARVVQWPKCAGDGETGNCAEDGNDAVHSPVDGTKGPFGEGAEVKSDRPDTADIMNIVSFTVGEKDKTFYWHGVLGLDPVKFAALQRDLAYFGGRH